MRRFNRFLLIVLLVVALPLQGGVAAAMLCCVPGLAHAASTGHDAASDASAMPTHCVEPAAPDEGVSLSSQPCSNCAACCIAGALTPATFALFSDTAFHERPLADPSGPPSFIAESAEHPPRSACV